MKKTIVISLLSCVVGAGVALAQGAGSTYPDAPKPDKQSTTGWEDKTAAPAPSSTAKPDTATPAAKPDTGTGTSANSGTFPSNVTSISVEKGKKVEMSGSLSTAQTVEGFALPAGCVAMSDKANLDGKQVLYSATLPAKADLTISVKPVIASEKFSVYAYTQPSTSFSMPGQISKGDGVMCKTATRADILGTDKVRSIKLSGGKTASNVVIGVVDNGNPSSTGTGTSSNTSSDFTITLDVH